MLVSVPKASTVWFFLRTAVITSSNDILFSLRQTILFIEVFGRERLHCFRYTVFAMRFVLVRYVSGIYMA